MPEEEIAKIVSSATAAPVTDVELEEGYLIVGSEVEILGARLPVRVEGRMVLQDGVLRFEPGRVEALGEPVPQQLARGLLGSTELVYPTDGLLFGGEVSGVEVHDSRLVLTGGWRIFPSGEPSRGRWLSWGVLFGIFRTGRRFPRGERFGRTCRRLLLVLLSLLPMCREATGGLNRVAPQARGTHLESPV